MTATTAAPQKVTVVGVDPFAEYHTNIQGKKAGKLTPVGYMGIGLGILMVVVPFMGPMSDGGQSAFTLALLGVGTIIASYLWVRR